MNKFIISPSAIQEKSDILKGLASIHQIVRVENGKGYDQSSGLKASAVHTMKTLPTGAMKGHTIKERESHRWLPPSEKESPNIFFSFTGKFPTKVFEALDL